MTNIDGFKGAFSDLVTRTPDDPAWYEGGLYHDNEDFGVPSLWMNSWYDLSVSPNLALFNHVRENASDAEVRNNQFMVIAPTLHCAMYRLKDPLIVGGAQYGQTPTSGSTRCCSTGSTTGPKGSRTILPRNTPRFSTSQWARTPGANRRTWPPANATTRTLYLASGGRANSLERQRSAQRGCGR